jgi:hypothetical protein
MSKHVVIVTYIFKFLYAIFCNTQSLEYEQNSKSAVILRRFIISDVF